MATLIEMPKLSDTMTVGTLTRWLKNEGDVLSNGDMIAEVETDKATMEVECFEDGVLIKQYCAEGSEVPVGGAIAAIGKEGESAPTVQAAGVPTEAPEEEVAESEPEPSAPSAAAPSMDGNPLPPTTGGRIKASPLARKIAAERGIDLTTVHPSGPNGRIVKKDVLNAQPSPVTTSAPREEPPTPTAATLEALDIPVSNMRKSIAKTLIGSKTQAPHFYLQIEVDGAPLDQLRRELNDKLTELPPEQGGARFTVNDLTLKAAAESIRRVPEMNRSWEGEFIRQHPNVHLAFGVAIDDGLITPVIRAAETKNLRQIATEAKMLIKKAREKKLTPNEMSGSTLTVTNLGMFGISDFYGIINPNNACILSIGATVKKPVVNQSGEIVVGQTMKIGLSGDHRTIDGALGARYLQALKEIIETPALMLL